MIGQDNSLVRRTYRGLVVMLLPLLIAAAQRPAVLTDGALTEGKGSLGVALGFEYLEKWRAPAPEAPDVVLRLPVTAVHFGIAENVNFDLDWRGGLVAFRPDGTPLFDWGDLTISTRMSFLHQQTRLPAIGLRTAVKLPNARYGDVRLGSNQMDYHAALLLSRQFGGVEARVNLGFSIIGHPEVAGMQDDLFALGAAALFPLQAGGYLFLEVHGVTGYEENDDKLLTRLGAVVPFGGLSLGSFASVRVAGNNRDYAGAFEASQTWSIGFLVQKEFAISPLEAGSGGK